MRLPLTGNRRRANAVKIALPLRAVLEIEKVSESGPPIMVSSAPFASANLIQMLRKIEPMLVRKWPMCPFIIR